MSEIKVGDRVKIVKFTDPEPASEWFLDKTGTVTEIWSDLSTPYVVTTDEQSMPGATESLMCAADELAPAE